jgi:hypothetical protein
MYAVVVVVVAAEIVVELVVSSSRIRKKIVVSSAEAAVEVLWCSVQFILSMVCIMPYYFTAKLSHCILH